MKYTVPTWMRSKSIWILTAFVMFTSIGNLHSQNCSFVTNGDFQQGNNFPSPWMATGNVSHVQTTNKYARFNDNNNTPNGTLQQQITTTECNDYELTFQLREGGAFNLSNMMGLSVSIDGVNQGSFFATGPSYTGFTVPFTATGSSTTILFTDVSNTTISIDVHLDNVEVCEISNNNPTLTIVTDPEINACESSSFLVSISDFGTATFGNSQVILPPGVTVDMITNVVGATVTSNAAGVLSITNPTATTIDFEVELATDCTTSSGTSMLGLDLAYDCNATTQNTIEQNNVTVTTSDIEITSTTPSTISVVATQTIDVDVTVSNSGDGDATNAIYCIEDNTTATLNSVTLGGVSPFNFDFDLTYDPLCPGTDEEESYSSTDLTIGSPNIDITASNPPFFNGQIGLEQMITNTVENVGNADADSVFYCVFDNANVTLDEVSVGGVALTPLYQ